MIRYNLTCIKEYIAVTVYSLSANLLIPYGWGDPKSFIIWGLSYSELIRGLS